MTPYVRPSHEDIALCAYFIYLHEGSRQSHDLPNWFQAEHQLMADRKHNAGMAPDAPMPDNHLPNQINVA